MHKLSSTIRPSFLSYFFFQHLRDKFWNFLFYKFIFIFGVMNVQTLEEVVSWVAWFTILGFFTLLTQLSKDRFEYVSGQFYSTRNVILYNPILSYRVSILSYRAFILFNRALIISYRALILSGLSFNFSSFSVYPIVLIVSCLL